MPATHTSGLRLRRPSHDVDSDSLPQTVDSESRPDELVPQSPVNYTSPTVTIPSTLHENRARSNRSLHAGRQMDGSQGPPRAEAIASASDSSAPPILAMNTSPQSAFASTIAPTYSHDSESSTQPTAPRTRPYPSRPAISPTSPGTRDRGYSLRRSLFARGIDNQSDTAGIELQEAGPSVGSRITRFITPEPRNKKTNTIVRVESVPENDLPLRLDPAKKGHGSSALPNYDLWARQRSRRAKGLFSKVEATYEQVKKKIIKIHEIPPSKDGRHIDLHTARGTALIDERTNKHYISNVIRSCRYTIWSFLPRQLLFQFGKLANFYFLVISILQMVPGLSTTGTYTTIVPLLVFITISMAKEGYDDLRRYNLDKAENRKEATVLRTHGEGEEAEVQVPASNNGQTYWATVQWQDVKVGDIIKLERDEFVPADIILLHSAGPNNIAYIETMALDGETNLKAKQPPPILSKNCHDIDAIAECNAHFVVEDPNIDLYNFDGRITLAGETLPLTTNEVVYRGSVLRNTSKAIGIVINSGEECKIRMNANKNPRIKAPSLQGVVNRVVIVVVIFVLFLASFNTVAYQIWSREVESRSWYLARARVAAGPILTGFIIMFNTMIPLSLYVSLEIIKVGQLLLMNDVDMYDPISDTPMEARTTTINEELGQVSYIFSDKTGTLTDNVMRFRKMSVAGFAWLHDFDLQKEAADLASTEQKTRGLRKGKCKVMRDSDSSHFTANYSMSAPLADTGARVGETAHMDTIWKSSARPAKAQPELNTEELLHYLQHKPHGVFARKARFFLLSLALCHTCLPETKADGTIDFQAASPDELALVRAAQELGYMVVDRAAQTITLKSRPEGPNSHEVSETYEVLDVIEFTSKRKRMSIIVRFPDGRRCVFCKGADSAIMKRLKLAPLAIEKAVEVERRASVRKSLEAEHALRRQSDANSPRASLSRDSIALGRKSFGGSGRQSIGGHPLRPVRDNLDSWLTERETDVDLSAVDNPAAYITPRTSLHQQRQSFASSEPNSLYGEDEENDYYDNLVDEGIAVNEAAVIERCFQHIDDFATEGLRTLLYGYRFLDESEYLIWKKIYLDASTSLVNRQAMIESAGEMIEQDFELAGATAIEDKLQKGVPETIDKLRRANIKMWMLTGDKRETAINIGHSCRLIKDYSKVIILDHETGKVEQLMATSLLDIGSGTIPHSVVVVDGQTLSEIESDDTLALLFFDLAVIADSVICCRASPSQKALLVKKIRQKVSRSVTLAIGDGANDIAMIQEAHVGIGITGKEGLQAARISDYSIAQFRFLQKLLLVHGRWNYVRTGKYILGTFWKEMLFYLTQALYQRWNGYSGTSLYESWSLSMFNTLFTSLPVIFLGIFEQDLRATTLLAVPELYTYGQRNEAFNFRKYYAWMFMGSAEAVLVFFLMYGLFAYQQYASDNGIFAMGDLSFSCCVLIINTKLLFIEMHRKTIVSVIGWFLSVIGWTLWNLLLSYIYSDKESIAYQVKSGFVKQFGGSGHWWLVLLIIVFAFIVFELGVSSLRKTFLPTDVDLFQELEQDPASSRRFQDAARGAMESLPPSKQEQEIRDLLDDPRLGCHPDHEEELAAQRRRNRYSSAKFSTESAEHAEQRAK